MVLGARRLPVCGLLQFRPAADDLVLFDAGLHGCPVISRSDIGSYAFAEQISY